MAKKTTINLKFREKDIPEKYDTDEKKRDFLVESIDEIFSSLSSVEGNATEYRIRVGQYLNVLKEILKRMKIKFGPYVKNDLPYVARTAQRWMKLAKHVRLDKRRYLTSLGDVRLLTLIRLAKGEPIHKYLKENEVKLQSNINDNSKVHKFREEVQTLINSQRAKPKTSINKALSSLHKILHRNLVKIESFRKDDSATIDPGVVKKTLEEAKELVASLKEMQEDQDEETSQN